MENLLIALPGLLFSSITALPLLIGTVAAVRHVRAGRRAAYFSHLLASIAGGAVALALLWSSLFGDSLSKSSTGGLIFAIAPVYAAVAQGVIFFLAMAIFKNAMAPGPVSPLARLPLLLPLLMLAVLMLGLIQLAADGNDSQLAQRASNPKTLQQLYEKSRAGGADAFAVPFNLAQNPNAPPEMLSELARHDHPSVRSRVASNPRTPQAVVAALRNDCAKFVRKVAVDRLGPDQALLPTTEHTGTCALERWR